MSQDSDLCSCESFNSFLAGVLLTRQKISNFEFCDLMSRFEAIYNVTVVSSEGNSDIRLSIYLDDNNITLVDDYDSIVIVDGWKMTVSNYLYSITSPRVREFLGISPKEEKIEKNSFIKRLFRRKVKTKAYV